MCPRGQSYANAGLRGLTSNSGTQHACVSTSPLLFVNAANSCEAEAAPWEEFEATMTAFTTAPSSAMIGCPRVGNVCVQAVS
eukprot:CAMPEP_0206142856 /NCGR_PEP_ID=MMETSP1473-20131121/18447_1 /ASSEMBLY_ACC=CAM_ASM_001109 /TAXON_ID=1461547 /ORGANISM="Stichococcus sp, Strain RCC1054" /LENGTH=81 /DNA_ID=CAMNT_0053538007 /DNA_START=1 /DNA_END=246 /DNA_ORIENTATION=+